MCLRAPSTLGEILSGAECGMYFDLKEQSINVSFKIRSSNSGRVNMIIRPEGRVLVSQR